MENNATVVAIRYLDFWTDEENGKPKEHVCGTHVYVAVNTGERGWRGGVEVVKIWHASGHELEENGYLAVIQPGDVVPIAFTRRGKVVLVNAIGV